LHSNFSVIIECFPPNFLAFSFKLGNEGLLTFGFKSLKLLLDQSYGFLFELIAAVARDHGALVRQIQLLLVSDRVPGLVNVKCKTIHGHIFLFAFRQEQTIFGANNEAGLQLCGFGKKLIFLVNFVRKHGVFKVEEIGAF
jgi:hypothetical protein